MGSFRAVIAVTVFLFFLNACSTTPKSTPQSIPESAPESAPESTHKSLFVLMPDSDDKVGEIVVSNKGESQIISKAGYATEVKDTNTPPSSPFPLEESEITKIFGEALAAQPEPPLRYLLYFKLGSTDLTKKSEKLLRNIIKTIKNQKSTHISVVGHTDRLGSRQFNSQLGLDRAEWIKKHFISKGIDPSTIDVDSHGEDSPLIKTKDEVAEPRNRRVEVTVE